MGKQALYQRIVESQVFPTQAEAIEWGNETKSKYNEAGNPAKVDVVPADATRRRWKATVYLKV